MWSVDVNSFEVRHIFTFSCKKKRSCCGQEHASIAGSDLRQVSQPPNPWQSFGHVTRNRSCHAFLEQVISMALCNKKKSVSGIKQRRRGGPPRPWQSGTTEVLLLSSAGQRSTLTLTAEKARRYRWLGQTCPPSISNIFLLCFWFADEFFFFFVLFYN